VRSFRSLPVGAPCAKVLRVANRRVLKEIWLRTWTKSSGTDDYAWCGRRISRPVTCKLKLRFGLNFRDLPAPCANGATISNLIDGKCTSTLVKSVNGPATALNSEVYAYG
jgi:hypothetical protein